MKAPSPQAVFFDFDGVILESADVKTVAFGRLFEARGQEVSRQCLNYHLANIGRSRYEKFAWLYENVFQEHLDAGEMNRLDSVFSALVEKELLATPFVPGALECLEVLSADIPCFVVSASPERDLLTLVMRRSISRFFSAVKGSPVTKVDNVGTLLLEFSLQPGMCVFIGDATADHEAAKAHTIPFVGRVPRAAPNPFDRSVPTIPELWPQDLLSAWVQAIGPAI